MKVGFTMTMHYAFFPMVLLSCVGPDEFSLREYQGQYVSLKFLRILEETKSPPQAADSAGLVSFILKSTDSTFALPDEENFYILSRAKEHPGKFAYYANFTFHTSDIQSILSLSQPEDGFREMITTDQKYASSRRYLKFISDGRDVLLILKEVAPNRMDNLDTLKKQATELQRLINRTVIAGRFVTADGVKLRIAEDGTGSWGDSLLEYRLALDSFYADNAIIEVHATANIPIANLVMAFEYVGNALKLYHTTSNEIGRYSRDSNPAFLTITRSSE